MATTNDLDDRDNKIAELVRLLELAYPFLGDNDEEDVACRHIRQQLVTMNIKSKITEPHHRGNGA